MKILISGATGEVGTAISSYLASEGHELILVARDMEKLTNLRKSLSLKGKQEHKIISIDFDDSVSVKNCLKNQEDIDGVVINPPRIPSSNELFPENNEWIEVFKKVFLNPLDLLKQAIEKMPNDKMSKVVIISGISSIQVMSRYAINSAIRAAWAAQAKTISMNFSHLQINTLSLGGIDSPAYREKIRKNAESEGLTEKSVYEKAVSNVPLKKYASLAEIAVAVANLLGPFSDHLTGNNLIFDGGYTKTF